MALSVSVSISGSVKVGLDCKITMVTLLYINIIILYLAKEASYYFRTLFHDLNDLILIQRQEL